MNSITGTNSGTSTDALGRKTTYTASSIQRPAGLTWTATLNSAGQVASVTDGTGTWSYSYSTSGGSQTTTVTDPNGDRKTYVSNPSLDVITSYTDGAGRTTSYGYDGYGRITSVTHPHGDVVSYTYDENETGPRGNVTTTTWTPAGGGTPIVTHASYDPSCGSPAKCNKPNSTTDARGAVTSYTYDNNTGVLLTLTKPAGANGVQPQVRYSYSWLSANIKNASGSMVQGAPIYLLTGVSSCNTQSASQCIGTADETRTTVSYNANANLAPSSVTVAAGDGSISSTQNFTYDVFGNLATSTSPLGAVTSYRYDADRELIGVVGPDPDGSGPLTPSAVRLSYNPDGVVSQTEQGTVNSASDGDWANFSSVTQQGLARDSLDRLVDYWTNGGGAIFSQTQYTYDNANRLICQAVRMNPSSFGSQASACSLSTQGTDGPDQITQTNYNSDDSVSSKVAGYATSNAHYLAQYSYNSDGALGNQGDGNGDYTCYGYDGLGRKVQVFYPNPSSRSCNYSDYDSYGYDANGNLTSHRLRDGTTLSFGYDALNRMTTGGDGATYTYDNAGRVLSGSYQGAAISLTYNALGEKVTESNPWNSGLLHSFYDAAGRREAMFWPDGFYVNWDHDAAGDLTAVRENGATSGVGVLASYTYDSLGRRTNAVFAGSSSVLSQGFLFDSDSRPSITGYAFAQSSANLQNWQSYNAAGQLKVRDFTNDGYDWNRAASVQQSYAANGLNQLSSAGSTRFTYNARGDLTSDGTNNYGYDVMDRLTSVNGEGLSYDAFGRLACVSGGGSQTCYLHDGTEEVGEYAGAGGSLLRRHVYGSGTDDPIVWYEGSGTSDRRWLLKDQQGSVIAIANGSGQLLASNSYDPYGASPSTPTGRFGYTGQAFIPEVGLYDYKARMYSPTLGRFLQTDPIGYGDGLNWYAYTHNDPVNGTDPTGLACGGYIGQGCTEYSLDGGGPGLSGGDGESGGSPSGITFMGQPISSGSTVAFGPGQFTLGNYSLSYVGSGVILPGLVTTGLGLSSSEGGGGLSSPTNLSSPQGMQITHNVPPHSLLCKTRSGAAFYAPPNFNLGAIVAAGQAGGLNPAAALGAVGHFGTFDYQREGGGSVMGSVFVSAYTNASNFAVGAYLYGAGFSQQMAGDISNTFAGVGMMSSNAGDQNQNTYRDAGYQAASEGFAACSPQ